ncbi:MAG: hypothetical protein UU48_C0005G0010 [Candidatus Uhrbacteria bacterium GW2011_GWF2_41_16]|uniref:Uncharacterized protein n=1 Tax=Candidatus Uhrbacteria bacterium GW2011_GWF2_41_16 TaxID=1618997 RepID=A0A0G0VB86_9BACT|nr:MAG: hypothetical protein UU48_C0005G0010 [Candidatus Uhrbacteria bacterium GW2011_GWF2_41_16]
MDEEKETEQKIFENFIILDQFGCTGVQVFPSCTNPSTAKKTVVPVNSKIGKMKNFNTCGRGGIGIRASLRG